MFSRKELRTICMVALVTVAALLVLDKLFVSHTLSNDLPAVTVVDKTTLLSHRHDRARISLPTPLVTLSSHNTQPPTSVDPTLRGPTINQPALSPLPVANPPQKAQQNAKLPVASLLNSTIKCPIEVERKYGTADTNWRDNLNWCKIKMESNHVSIGRSWGSLSRSDKQQWDLYMCNELVSVGRLQSCDQRWGWGFLNEWRAAAVPVVQGVSNVTCARDIKTSIFCKVKMYIYV